RFGWRSTARRTNARYRLRSAWQRVARTAGPLLALSRRHWMPAASAARAIRPPSASTSFTRWPLPIPPMAGLQLIAPIVSMAWVSSSVRAPARAAASAASVPACPPPTTITSWRSVAPGARGWDTVMGRGFYARGPERRRPPGGGRRQDHAAGSALVAVDRPLHALHARAGVGAGARRRHRALHARPLDRRGRRGRPLDARDARLGLDDRACTSAVPQAFQVAPRGRTLVVAAGAGVRVVVGPRADDDRRVPPAATVVVGPAVAAVPAVVRAVIWGAVAHVEAPA